MTKFSKLTIVRHNLLGSGEETGQGIILNEVLYDETGHEIERFNYNTDGDLEEHISITMEGANAVEEKLQIDGELTERTTRVFNDNGKVISETRYYLEGGSDIITYEYDGNNLVRRTVVDSDGEEGEKEVREYPNDKLVREVQYNLFGNVELEKIYEYEEDGSLSEVTEISYRGDFPEKTVSIFDESGKMTMEKKYDPKGRLIARTAIQYHENNQPLIFEEESTRGLKKTVLEYDESGNNTRQEETDGDGKRISLIERTYTEEGHALTAEVIIEPSGYQAGQHYRLEYIYE